MDMYYLSCKKAKVLNYDSFIFSLEEISQKEKRIRPISHERNTHLGKSCVTMTYLMDKFYEKTELIDVIYEECTKSSGTTSKTNFEKNQ